MTIEKGQAWGEPWAPDAGTELAEAADDADLADQVGPLDGSAPARPVLVRSGDVLRTLGLEAPRPEGQRFGYPIDVGLARLGRAGADPVELPFVAHLTVRNRPLTGIGPGLSLVVMNAAWLGSLRLGPRAHPNDGLLDVTEGTVGPIQRWEGTRRARSGSHLPHPRLRTSRARTWEGRWPRPVTVWLDGRRRGRFDRVSVELVADAALVVA